MALMDVAFKNVKAFGVTRLEVAMGEKFKLYLTPEIDGKVRWLWENDPVLQTRVTENVAEVEATEVGDATTFIFDEAMKLIMRVDIKVVDSIKEPAAKLQATVGNPVTKRT
jgi:hypothetical protein